MNPRKVAVTLVCADSDVPTLEPVVERLRGNGYDVELVGGVDTQPRKVGEALDRCGARGVVIACTGRRLDGPAMRKIEGVFGARRGPDHALVRVELSPNRAELTAAVQRATEAFAANQGRLLRPPPDGSPTREVIPVAGLASVAMPVVRLSTQEPLEGDTARIHLVDNPKAAELSRRRRAAREHEHERGHAAREVALPIPDTAPTLPPSLTEQMHADAAKLDRMMVAMIVGAGVIAVLAALSFSGTL